MEFKLARQALSEQPAGDEPHCTGGIAPAAVIGGDPVDQLHNWAGAPSSETNLADHMALTCLHNDERGAMKARKVPPARQPIVDQSLAALEAGTLGERDPHPLDPACGPGVAVQRQGVGR